MRKVMVKNPTVAHAVPDTIARAILWLGAGWVLVRAGVEFYDAAWGTGNWLGEFSFQWGAMFAVLVVFDIAALAGLGAALWLPNRSWRPDRWLAPPREKLRHWLWAVAFFVLILPLWFLQYTPWGLVFSGLYVRMEIWALAVLVIGILLHRGEGVLGWSSVLAALILTAGTFTVAAAMTNVTSYPFSLGWSEGNRLWDYSVLFGRHLYDYPLNEPIYVLLDPGRQLIGGIPFLIPGISIAAERFWLGLTTTIPYVLLGLAAFRFQGVDRNIWLLAGVWALLFLKQGPIHPPLVFCAFFTALIWERPLWLSLPLIALTGLAAAESRFTWLFAPGIWIGVLELTGAMLAVGQITSKMWARAASLFAAGSLGGYVGPRLVSLWQGEPQLEISLSATALSGYLTEQPLLWYRLLPNATYGIGILAGLAVATAPLIAVLLYLAISRRWPLSLWQMIAINLALLVFLVVGLVVSTKIGGGGDLHNMDMFLIGLLFAGAVAFRNGGHDWLRHIGSAPIAVRTALVLLFFIPALQPLINMHSIRFVEDTVWLSTLTETPPGRPTDMLPPDDRVQAILVAIRTTVEAAKQTGEVLFIDQRQLLTFGYIVNVPFVPEYEKKILMNDALGEAPGIFEALYADLAAHRFAVIISEPLRAPIKDSTYQFGEENNSWVKWVVNPVLCYYDPQETFKDVQIELLVPKAEAVDCSNLLPLPKNP